MIFFEVGHTLGIWLKKGYAVFATPQKQKHEADWSQLEEHTQRNVKIQKAALLIFGTFLTRICTTGGTVYSPISIHNFFSQHHTMSLAIYKFNF